MTIIIISSSIRVRVGFSEVKCHYSDLRRTSDWLKQISLSARPIRSTTQIRVELHHQYGLSAVVLKTSLHEETSVALWNIGCFFSLQGVWRLTESKVHNRCYCAMSGKGNQVE